MQKLELIVARASNGVIGLKGKMPWHIAEDLRHFKETTMGCPVIMGRKTWESIGRALPGRINIVLTRQPGYTAVGAHVVADLAHALELVREHSRVFIIGGAQLYAQTLGQVQTAWVTQIEAEPQGDAFFADLDPAVWQERLIATLEKTALHPKVCFYRYERKTTT